MLQIVDRDSDKVIGGIGVDRNVMSAHKVELGYWLNPQFWNRGIVTNAVKGFIDFIWNSKVDSCGMRINELLTLDRIIRIECSIAVDNIYSSKVVEKCGFQREGLHKKAHKFRDGTFGDAVTLALIKEDFVTAK